MLFVSAWNCRLAFGVKEFSELSPEPVLVAAYSCGPPVRVSNEYLFLEKRAPSVAFRCSVKP